MGSSRLWGPSENCDLFPSFSYSIQNGRRFLCWMVKGEGHLVKSLHPGGYLGCDAWCHRCSNLYIAVLCPAVGIHHNAHNGKRLLVSAAMCLMRASSGTSYWKKPQMHICWSAWSCDQGALAVAGITMDTPGFGATLAVPGIMARRGGHDFFFHELLCVSNT